MQREDFLARKQNFPFICWSLKSSKENIPLPFVQILSQTKKNMQEQTWIDAKLKHDDKIFIKWRSARQAGCKNAFYFCCCPEIDTWVCGYQPLPTTSPSQPKMQTSRKKKWFLSAVLNPWKEVFFLFFSFCLWPLTRLIRDVKRSPDPLSSQLSHILENTS